MMPTPLWTPSKQRIEESNIYKFIQEINHKYGTDFNDYNALYQWSITNLEQFWKEVWHFVKIKASKDYKSVVNDVTVMENVQWFSGCRLNFAENLLRYRDDEVALIFRGEDKIRKTLTYKELYMETARMAAALRQSGVSAGDRLVGFMPNMAETIIAMLAATSIGAIWSSCSPDFGIKGVLDRFGQTKPKILFTADGYFFKGKQIDSLQKISEIAEEIPSIEKVVVVSYTRSRPDISKLANGVYYEDFIDNNAESIIFAQLPFSHPLYIMYSSGTTGLPKCMVQSAGGILLHHLKELFLHTDLKRNDTIFYYTTCGWMMWNWLTSSLATGATIVLFDGNPFHPTPDVLWHMAEQEKLSVFGTSAGYISALRNTGVSPGKQFDLQHLKTLLSTGSPLSKDDFHYVYKEIKKDLLLASISGGSDLNGCFALGNPISPVYSGELQCRGLGMKVFAYNEEGRAVTAQKGELVCTAPFPSMPIYFWDDGDGSKYKSAYFEGFPGVWTHGDYIEITERGGLIIYGRSDTTLNPGGVRIGTAEIYRTMDQISGVEDSVVVGQKWRNDTRILLFVKMKPNHNLTDSLQGLIRKNIRNNSSPRHVPAKIIAVPDIPYTLNMKKVEVAVQKVIHGQEVKNKDALKNPGSLDYFKNVPEINS